MVGGIPVEDVLIHVGRRLRPLGLNLLPGQPQAQRAVLRRPRDQVIEYRVGLVIPLQHQQQPPALEQ